MGDDRCDDLDRDANGEGDHSADTDAREEARLLALCTAFQKSGNKIAPACGIVQRQGDQRQR